MKNLSHKAAYVCCICKSNMICSNKILVCKKDLTYDQAYAVMNEIMNGETTQTQNAAFLAAADPDADGRVHMKHYLNAIKYEFVKVGKVFTKSDFEPYAEEVGLA